MSTALAEQLSKVLLEPAAASRLDVRGRTDAAVLVALYLDGVRKAGLNECAVKDHLQRRQHLRPRSGAQRRCNPATDFHADLVAHLRQDEIDPGVVAPQCDRLK